MSIYYQCNLAMYFCIIISYMKESIDQNFRQLSSQIYSKINDMQVFQKRYLRPIQILLKTHRTKESMSYGSRSSLAQGLMIASKESINQRTYIPIELFRQSQTRSLDGTQISQYQEQRLKEQFSLDKQIEFHQHRMNLLNLLKKVNSPSSMREEIQNLNHQSPIVGTSTFLNHGQQSRKNLSSIHNPSEFQIAICVCAYSENAEMLKESLISIKQNIISLVKSGVRQDAIGVFVFFDGIEKIDPSIIQYISRQQNQEITFQQNFYNYQTVFDDFLKASKINDDETKQKRKEIYSKLFARYNSMIIFNQNQLRDRKERSIKQVHKTYMQIIQLKKTIQILKTQPNISYEMLPDRVREQFLKLAKRLKQYLKKDSKRILIDLLYRNIEKQKVLCHQALIRTENQCDAYLDSKKNISYLSMHRPLIYSKSHIDVQVQEIITSRCKNRRGGVLTISFDSKNNIDSVDQIGQKQEEETNKNIHMNLFYCVKYRNEGKLSSHNWFFNGFCKQLNPHYVILIDVGLKAKENSIFSMYQHLKKHPNLGGVCGHMSIKMQRDNDEFKSQDVDCLTGFAHLIVDIQKAQQVQYHFAHLLDKPFQSFFKYIHVLPGAFSGYNMLAIHSPDDKQEQTFRKYFESLNKKITDNHIVETKVDFKWIAMKVFLPDFISNLFVKVNPDSEEQLLCSQNMNLAEDRILCFGIHKNGYDLAYMPDSFSEVDPIKNLHSMMGQRKRWINGSYFAFQQVKEQFSQFNQKRTSSSLLLRLQMLFLTLVNIVSYFAITLFLFTFVISMKAFYYHILGPIFQKAFATKEIIPYFIETIVFIFVFFVFTVIYYSLNLRYSNTHFKKLIYLSSTIMGFFSIIVIVVQVIELSGGQTNHASTLDPQQKQKQEYLTNILRYVIMSIFGFHAIAVIIHSILYKLQIVIEVVFGVISFLFYAPTYLIIFNIYALCRVDDISWGTKGRDQQQKYQQKLKEKWKLIKFVHVFKYIFWNSLVSTLFLSIELDSSSRIMANLCIMSIISFILGVKLVFGLIYSIFYKSTLQKVKIQRLSDNFNFISEISTIIANQKQLEITQDKVLSNISQLINSQDEENQQQCEIKRKSLPKNNQLKKIVIKKKSERRKFLTRKSMIY